jgi:PqqD family protein of HPr-rel-A system
VVASATWYVPHAAFLRWREWDGEFVLYHELSGDTHRLNILAASALRMLIAEPMSAELLSMRLARAQSPESRPQSPEPIADLLSRLSALGLIDAQ